MTFSETVSVYYVAHTHVQRSKRTFTRMSPSAVERQRKSVLSLHFWVASCHLFYCSAFFPSFVYIPHSKLYSSGGLWDCVCLRYKESQRRRCWLCPDSSFCPPPSAFSWPWGKPYPVSSRSGPLCFTSSGGLNHQHAERSGGRSGL